MICLPWAWIPYIFAPLLPYTYHHLVPLLCLCSQHTRHQLTKHELILQTCPAWQTELVKSPPTLLCRSFNHTSLWYNSPCFSWQPGGTWVWHLWTDKTKLNSKRGERSWLSYKWRLFFRFIGFCSYLLSSSDNCTRVFVTDINGRIFTSVFNGHVCRMWRRIIQFGV